MSGPVLPAAAPSTVARMLLERYLPAFVRDANRALELSASTERLAEQAAIDPLTGLAASAGLDAGSILPPAGGRAPGWRAGLTIAARRLRAR